jgi:glycosyltransferase involved in cell wall biosynthesis
MSEPLRVLQLAKHFDPDTGGIETVTLNISDMLLSHGIQADVLCTEVKGPYQERERGYRVIRCPADLSIGNKRLSWRYLRLGWTLEHDYDCAIVHLPNPLAVAVALKWRKPVILLWHADIPQAAIRRATSLFDRQLARKAAAVIGPTPVHLSGSRHADVLHGRHVIIPYPFNRSLIPTSTGRTGFAERLRAFRKDRAMSISVGRLVPYKGFDVLIEAARDFGDRLCAVIVGTGPLAADLARTIDSAGVGDRVLMAGALSPEELADTFAQARLGCMPSVTAAEMYGIAQVESLAAGLPMVSADIPRSGVPYVNRHDETGLVVPVGDPRALADAMLRIVNDDALWQRLSAGALRAIAQQHDLGPVSERYAKLIKDVVGRATAR